MSDPTQAAGEPARAMTLLETMRSHMVGWVWRVRRRLPYLVWHNDEVDVQITFTEHTIDPEGPPFSHRIFDTEDALKGLGIGFDRGMGYGGRDWEWDWSLKGPVHVKFRGRAKKPELRRSPPRLKVVP